MIDAELAPDYPDGTEALPEIHPEVMASDQVVEATMHLDRHPTAFLRWPFATLDTLTGPMGPGEVWYACSFSGGGKTTFVCSAIDPGFRCSCRCRSTR
jgi:hypothetical protein